MRILPFFYAKMYVYECTVKSNFENRIQNENITFYRLGEISIDNILCDLYYTKILYSRLRKGYDGVVILNRRKELMGYSFWTKKGNLPPTNVPNIPEKTIWVFNTVVVEKFRGHGLQKDIICFRDFVINKCYPNYRICSDIYENNYASRKSVLKSNYVPCGIYHIIVIGLRRNKYLNYRFGYWDKKGIHKEILK